MAKLSKKKKETFVDDGRVIAPMNVEGMPGYRPEQGLEAGPKGEGSTETLDRQQTRWAMGGALVAGLVVAGVMSLGIIVVVLLFL